MRESRWTWVGVCIGWLACGEPAVAAGPLTKTGPCPELVREPFDTEILRANVLERPENANVDYTLKSHWNTVQTPLLPEQSVNCSLAPAGFKTEVWVSENGTARILNVMGFTFDERGRMWAVETYDYPNTMVDAFKGHDRVIILEDTDGDRVADKLTEFVSGISMAEGLELVPEGVVVAMAPHLVLFTDKNGDDKADTPMGTVLYTGFSKTDMHGSITNLKFGMDNWLYGVSGYDGGKVGGISFGSGIWRVRTDGSKFEYIGPTQNGNSAGMGMMEDGQLFASAANNMHTQHSVLPGVLSANITGYGEAYDGFSITKDIVEGDFFVVGGHVGNFTAAANHEIYTARLFPKAYWNRAAFVCEPTGHLVNQDFLDQDKSSWKANRNAATIDIFASSDAWTAPIAAKVGPDGAVWVLDWYSYFTLHNIPGADPSLFGPGGGWINTMRIRSRERIYRVVPADGRLDPVLDLRAAGFRECVAAFRNGNLLWRMQAQRMLLRKAVTETQKAQVESLLVASLRNRLPDSVGIDPAALHCLWTAQGLGLFAAHAAVWDPILKECLLHPSAAVRANAMKAMPRTAASVRAILEQGRVNDDDPHVRLAALIALSEMPKLDGIRMWATYHNLDKWSQQAFGKAQAGSGISESADKPLVPSLLQPVWIAAGTRAPPAPRLRFQRTAMGRLRIRPDASLPPGMLTVYDAHGRLIASSRIAGFGSAETLPEMPVGIYNYRFAGPTGITYSGRVMPAPSP